MFPQTPLPAYLRLIAPILATGILLILAFMGLQTTQAQGISVCASGCDFTTLQAAIDANSTAPGATIAVLDPIHTEADIQVTKDLTIQGEGARRTIVQAFASLEESDERVFFINRGATVAIRDMTIRHGNPKSEPESGGGIRNEGTLTLENVVVRDNSASAGGGILNDGTLTLLNTIVEDNESRGGAHHYIECGTGGGIKNQEGLTTLINSTVRNNVSKEKGGGFHVACKGTLVLVNSTVSGNRSAMNGGGIYLNGIGHFTHSTISYNMARNGGGIMVEGTGEKGLIRGSLHFTATLIADNIATMEKYGVPDCYLNSHSSIDTNQYNLIENGECESAFSGDPMLDPAWPAPTEGDDLAAGYEPQAHALLPGSLAIDAIPAADCALPNDQYGAERPQGEGCDIGAFEAPQASGLSNNPLVQTLLISSLLLIVVAAGLVIARRFRVRG